MQTDRGIDSGSDIELPYPNVQNNLLKQGIVV